MRKRITTIFILLLLSLLIFTGCGHYIPRNKKADDDISKAVYKKVGKKVFYQGTKEWGSGVLEYDFLIRDYEDETLLTNIVDTVNKTLEEKKEIRNICVSIREEMNGGTEPVAGLYTYKENSPEENLYEPLIRLAIYGTDRSLKGDSSRYNNASTYINLKGIKELTVTEKIAQSAEDEGIDWYEVWPDLEYYEVLESR